MLQIVNASSSAQEKTIAVFGAGRGGTSALFGLLRELGVASLPVTHPLKHESSPVRYCNGEVDLEQTKQICRRMDSEHPVWGWKAPVDIFKIDRVAHVLRNPHFLVVTRSLTDVLASASRRESIELRALAKDYGDLNSVLGTFISFNIHPLALISFEFLVKEPAKAAEQLAAWLQLTPSEEELRRASSFTSGEVPEYKRLATDSTSEADPYEVQRDSRNAQRAVYTPMTRILEGRFSDLSRDLVQADNICRELREQVVASLNEKCTERSLSKDDLWALSHASLAELKAAFPGAERPPAETHSAECQPTSQANKHAYKAEMAAAAARGYSIAWSNYVEISKRRLDLQRRMEELSSMLTFLRDTNSQGPASAPTNEAQENGAGEPREDPHLA